MSQKPRISALIVAAGLGVRAGGGPKQYRLVAGKPLLRHAIERLLGHPGIAQLRVVIHPDHRALYEDATRAFTPPPRRGRLGGGQGDTPSYPDSPHPNPPLRGEGILLPPILGGAQRQDSVRLGLEALSADAPDYVLVHDAARAFLPRPVLDRIIAALAPEEGVVPALSVPDTVRRHSLGHWEEVSRENLLRVQTPQAFAFAPLLALHRAHTAPATDDAALWVAAGRTLRYVEGHEELRKVTTAADLEWANAHATAGRIATGMGFDVHELFPAGEKHTIRLGGIDISHDHKLHGHSDADVVLHAIVDALFGALGDGDIGSHFPPSDPQWKGADSQAFVAEALRCVSARGGRIQHLDLTVICESPKIGPHREAMREKIAQLLNLPLSYVSVKATTTERLGFTGRGEGIACQAVATVSLPWEQAAC